MKDWRTCGSHVIGIKVFIERSIPSTVYLFKEIAGACRVAKISGTPQRQQIPDSHRLQVSRYVFFCASSENLGRLRPGSRPGAATHGTGWFCSVSTRWWETFCNALHQMSFSWCFFRSRLASHILGVCRVQGYRLLQFTLFCRGLSFLDRFTQPSACPVYSTVADVFPFGECRKWYFSPRNCVVSALAAVDAHLDVRAWTDLLTLPSLLPVAFVRGRRGNTRERENEQPGRCQDWLDGLRAEL